MGWHLRALAGVLTLFERLDTLLELKIENERSQQRLEMLTASMNESTQAYSSLPVQSNGPGAMDASLQNFSFYPGQWSGRGDLLLSPVRGALNDGASGSSDIYPCGSTPSVGEDESEDKSKKKKVKVIRHSSYLHPGGLSLSFFYYEHS